MTTKVYGRRSASRTIPTIVFSRAEGCGAVAADP
jgi:hypothetical protein